MPRRPAHQTAEHGPGSAAAVTVAELLAQAGGTRSAPTGRAGRREPRRRLRWAVAAALGALLLVAVYYVGLYVYVDHTLPRVDALRTDAPDIISPQRQVDAANVLFVGSRSGRLDTATLLQLAPDRSRGVLVTFPGDAYVDVPPCLDADGRTGEPYTGSLASAFDAGGAGCTVSTLQLLTGIRINRYAELDDSGFAGMVDALGGVPGCAGGRALDGAAAVSVIGTGGGGGTASAARQQLLLGQLFGKVLSAGTLFNPVRLTSFLIAATGAVRIDEAATLGELKDLGGQLRQLDAQTLAYREAPVSAAGYIPIGSTSSYTLLDEPAGRLLFDAIIDGSALPPASPSVPVARSVEPGCP